MAHTVAAVRVT